MTIEDQCNLIAQEIAIASASLSALESRNAATDLDVKRVAGLSAVLRTLSWCRDHSDVIRSARDQLSINNASD